MNTRLDTTRRRLAAAAVGIVALSGTAVAVAATQNSSQAESAAVITNAAGRLNVTPAKLTDALQQALVDQVKAAVKAGTITQARADQMIAAITSGQMPLIEGMNGGRGRDGHDGRGKHGGMGGGMRIDDAAAAFLGITAQQLDTETQAGKTLAQVATAHGKTVAELKAAITTAVTNDLKAAVTAGKITAAQQTTMLAGLSAHIDQELNETHTGGGGNGFWGDGGGDAPPAGTSTQPSS